MNRLITLVLVFLFSIPSVAQTPPTSDPAAVSLAQKSVVALTGGASISDVTLNANVTSAWGSGTETGTATFRAGGTSKSRVDLDLSGGVTRSDIRNTSNSIPTGGCCTVRPSSTSARRQLPPARKTPGQRHAAQGGHNPTHDLAIYSLFLVRRGQF